MPRIAPIQSNAFPQNHGIKNKPLNHKFKGLLSSGRCDSNARPLDPQSSFSLVFYKLIRAVQTYPQTDPSEHLFFLFQPFYYEQRKPHQNHHVPRHTFQARPGPRLATSGTSRSLRQGPSMNRQRNVDQGDGHETRQQFTEFLVHGQPHSNVFSRGPSASYILRSRSRRGRTGCPRTN
jgi:hypothetical protein